MTTSVSDEYNSNIVIANEYILGRLISSGGFGSVHYGYSLNTHNIVAIKLEKNASKSYLPNEYKIMKTLKMPIDGISMLGIPNIYWFGKQDDYTIMVMDLLGINLEALNSQINRLIKKYPDTYTEHMKQKIILKVLFEMIIIIENLHRQGYIHKDIKPQNVLIENDYNIKDGLLKSNPPNIYIVDFGLTEQLYNNDGEHITQRKTGSFAGTIKYMSKNTHDGLQQSRLDDLESYMYLMLHLFDVVLPWSSLHESDKKKRIRKIKKMKNEIDYRKICEDAKLPNEVLQIINYINSLHFYSIPDYMYVKSLLYKMHLTL